MKKKAKRDRILYAHIQEKNDEWVKTEMKRLGYPETRGKSEFIDDLISQHRNKKAATV